jgi:hypothetical protein
MTDQQTPLDPESDPRGTPDTPQDQQPSTVATPEGDNEYAPDQPLKPAPEGLQRTPAIDTNKV